MADIGMVVVILNLDGGVGGYLAANYRRCGGGGYYAAINGQWRLRWVLLAKSRRGGGFRMLLCCSLLPPET